MRIFLLHGQYYVFSWGFNALAERLAEYGKVTQHSWDDQIVLPTIQNSVGPIVVIGHSLGANQLGWISKYIHRTINLGIAYDPSWLSPLVIKGPNGYYQTAKAFKKLICYHNTGAWLYGGSYYKGPNVELHEVSDFHLSITSNETLHKITIKAVEALA